MKKQLLFFIFLLLNFNIFSEEYILKKDFRFKNLDLKKDELLQNVSTIIEDCTKWNVENLYNLEVLFIDNKNNQNYIDVELLIPKDTIDVFDSEITFSGLFAKNKILVHENQIEILNHPVAYLETFKKYYPKEYDYYIINSYDNDIDILYRNYITNAVINLRSPNIDYDISILNIIKQDKNKYTLDCKAGHFTKQDKYTEKYINKNTLFTITLTIDGDYFIFSSDKFETEKFVVVDIEAEDFYYKVMNGQSVDLSNFNWPKHADGSCTITKESESDVIELPVKEEQRILVDQYSQDPELKLYYLYKTKHDTDLYEVPTLEERDYAKTIKKGTIVKYLRTDRDCTFDNIPSRWVFITTEIEKSYFLTALDEDIKFFCAASDLELIEDQETPIEILELEEEEKIEKRKKISIILLISIPIVILFAGGFFIIYLKRKKKRQ